MKDLNAIIFDCDGVIVDSEPQHANGRKELFARFGISPSEEGRSLIGHHVREFLSVWIEKYNIPHTLDEMIKIYFDEIFAQVKKNCPSETPRLKELLTEAKKRGLRLAVASSSSREYVDNVLRLYGLEGFFDAIATGDEVVDPKPKPDVYLLAASRLGVKPENCLAIEDSATGMRAAFAAGIACIGYRGTATAKNAELNECEKVVSDFSEVIEMIKR